MLKIFFDKYKYVVLAILFVVYSVGVWNVSGKVADNSHLRMQLRHSEEIIKIKSENEELLQKVSAEFQTSLTTLHEAQQQHYKAIEDALKDPRYTQCTTTDSVRDLYKRKLKGK